MENLTPSSSEPIEATCHCGAIKVTVPGKPGSPINECQCTICRRYGAAWAYYNTNDVKIEKRNSGSATIAYVWGDREIEFHFCQNCGCVMYWYPIKIPSGGAEMGANTRMMEPDAMKHVNRKIDYELLLMPLKSSSTAQNMQ